MGIDMKNKIIAIFALILATAVFYWVYMFSFNWLTCKSFESFYGAETRMVFPFFCEIVN